MPTIELLAEIELLKARAERAEHMARLWKRCAKSMKWRADCAMENDQDGWNQFKLICAKMDKKEVELAALKKDARMIAEFVFGFMTSAEIAARDRILEATKEEP